MARTPHHPLARVPEEPTAASTPPEVEPGEPPPRSRKSRPARAENAPHPWYRSDDRFGDRDPDPDVLAEFLKDSPLDTIVALLLVPEVSFGVGHGNETACRIDNLPSGGLLKRAILALRLERADPDVIAKYRDLTKRLRMLECDLAAVKDRVPREVAARSYGSDD